MKTAQYTKFLIASVVSVSMAAGPVLAQEAAPVTQAAEAPAAPVAAPTVAPAAAPAVAATPSAVGATQAAVPAATAADPWQQEFAVWQAASAGNTVEEYQGYLTGYPTGKFAAIAQARVVKLATAEEKAEQEADRLEDANANVARQPASQNFTVGTPMEESVLLSENSTRREVQGRLTSLGFTTGGTDGVMGPRSRTAISQWQTVVSAPVSGYISYDQLARLRADSVTVYPAWLASRPKALPPIRRSSNDQLVGRVRDDSADAAIALGVLGLAAGVIGGAAIAGGRHHGGPRYYDHRGYRRH